MTEGRCVGCHRTVPVVNGLTLPHFYVPGVPCGGGARQPQSTCETCGHPKHERSCMYDTRSWGGTPTYCGCTA